MSSPHVVDLPADPDATERLGVWLGHQLRPGDVVGLVGELGAGKTTLVRGLARGLGVDDPDAVHSPTYLLVVEHPGPIRLLHADAYLPQKLASMLEDGGTEYLFDPQAVAVVEWAGNLGPAMPQRTLWVELAVAPGGGRQVVLRRQRDEDYPFVAEMPKMG